jgi:hypothetical protein
MLKLETHGGFSTMKPRRILDQLVMQEMFLCWTPHDARNVRIPNFGGLVSGRITMSQVSTLNDRANKVMGIIQSVRSDTVLSTDLG